MIKSSELFARRDVHPELAVKTLQELLSRNAKMTKDLMVTIVVSGDIPECRRILNKWASLINDMNLALLGEEALREEWSPESEDEWRANLWTIFQDVWKQFHNEPMPHEERQWKETW